MKTSEFITAVRTQEKIIREARANLGTLHYRALTTLCPVKKGDLVVATEGVHAGRTMTVDTIQVITPIFTEDWLFRVRGPVEDSPDDSEAIIPFPES